MSDELSGHRERFAADPNATTSFERLEEHAIQCEAWDELAALYRQRADALTGDPAGRARILLQLGQLLEERLGDGARALDAYRDCARLDPSRRMAWKGLRRLYAARESWDAVLQVGELEANTLTEPAERARLFHELGEIWRERLGDAEQAEQMAQRARRERDAAPDAAEPELVDEDRAARVQNAWIAAARGDSSGAVASLREALEEDPSNVEAIDMLVTVLDGAERHAEMAELLERRAALAADPGTRAAVLSRLGLVREDQLGDLGGARSAYERALASDPGNPGAQVALLRIYRVTEAWTELRRLLEGVARQGSPDQRVGALCQLGALLERQFDDPEAAVSAFEEAMALDPDCTDAGTGLARLKAVEPLEPAADDEPAPGENRAVRVVGVLERKLERLESEGRGGEDAAIQLRLRLAELRGTTLDDTSAAIAVLEPCLAHDDALPQVAERLALLYERTGRHAALMELSTRAAAAAPDPAERAEWYRRAAETARSIGDSEAAVELFGRLLAERPGDRHAEAALQTLHRTRGEAGPLAELLRRGLMRAAPRDELPIHVELAGLLEGALEDDHGALAHWRRALALDPGRDDALDEALRCAEATGGALHQLELLDHLAASATAREDRARLLRRRGDVLSEGLGWREEATESWRRSLDLAPDQPEVRAKLASADAASPA